ncbi:hypothetical protein EV132_110157 [Rhizobium sullae]|uniref:Uncharacterized protein n=1 Tax=Rhizobium sullae TaxID=50338 RepID=A0A4R3PZG7_RHISU|nr:hypothetical protein EV132_110157 [Rhizobium sullae]
MKSRCAPSGPTRTPSLSASNRQPTTAHSSQSGSASCLSRRLGAKQSIPPGGRPSMSRALVMTSHGRKGRIKPAAGQTTGTVHANRVAVLARAFAASSSRSRGGCEVSSETSSSRAHAAIEPTARSNAASLRFDGLLVPLSFRTNCSAASWISWSVAGGSKLNKVLMFRHMTCSQSSSSSSSSSSLSSPSHLDSGRRLSRPQGLLRSARVRPLGPTASCALPACFAAISPQPDSLDACCRLAEDTLDDQK